MTWLIGSKSNVELYSANVVNAQAFPGNVTKTWAEPRKHPDKDKYAVQKHANIQPDSDMKEVEELPADWYPKEEI